jgi:hypothetical protein
MDHSDTHIASAQVQEQLNKFVSSESEKMSSLLQQILSLQHQSVKPSGQEHQPDEQQTKPITDPDAVGCQNQMLDAQEISQPRTDGETQRRLISFKKLPKSSSVVSPAITAEFLSSARNLLIFSDLADKYKTRSNPDHHQNNNNHNRPLFRQQHIFEALADEDNEDEDDEDDEDFEDEDEIEF